MQAPTNNATANKSSNNNPTARTSSATKKQPAKTNNKPKPPVIEKIVLGRLENNLSDMLKSVHNGLIILNEKMTTDKLEFAIKLKECVHGKVMDLKRVADQESNRQTTSNKRQATEANNVGTAHFGSVKELARDKTVIDIVKT